jgi:acetylornithine/succinyldiaminopimelate/putrescine aminotransferase
VVKARGRQFDGGTVLADYLTVFKCEGYIAGLKIAYAGDGNNVARSLLARVAIRVLIEEKLVEPSADLGKYFLKQLRAIRSSAVKEVRGRGLWMGIELHKEARPY